MSYKPKYCCQCGEKIERIEWRPWNSRRFCELCETDYRIYDWIPHLSGIAILLAVFTINFYFQKSEKPLNVSSNQLVSGVNNGKGIAANQSVAPVNANAVQIAAQTNGNALPVKFTTAKVSDVKTRQTESSTAESSEKVYFCGAATKKGMPLLAARQRRRTLLAARRTTSDAGAGETACRSINGHFFEF